VLGTGIDHQVQRHLSSSYIHAQGSRYGRLFTCFSLGLEGISLVTSNDLYAVSISNICIMRTIW
jgi:hypothetical protein